MIVVDCHTHSSHSHDCVEKLEDMVDIAYQRGLKYYAVTEHCDWDCLFGGFPNLRQINLSEYEKNFLEIREKYIGKDFYLAFGIECGYTSLANQMYLNELPKYNFDVIINSVHTIKQQDAYYADYFRNKTMEEAFLPYLDAVSESIDVPYDYDIIAHIGYVLRHAPYLTKTIFKDEMKDKVDIILKKIIAKDKTLEVNTNVKECGLSYLPEINILKRYKELGGDNIGFGSDAHKKCRIGENYDLVMSQLQSYRFKYITVYKGRRPERIRID